MAQRRKYLKKATPVWAEKAEHSGQVQTHEGVTRYQAGDYVVSNNPDGTDTYAVAADFFEAMYDPAT